MYELPIMMYLLGVSNTKAQWRSMYVQAVDKHWTYKILAGANEKMSLKCMYMQKYSIGNV